MPHDGLLVKGPLMKIHQMAQENFTACGYNILQSGAVAAMTCGMKSTLSVFLTLPTLAMAAPFSFDQVRALASERAAKPYREPDNALADFWKNLTYDQHRDIRFKMEEGLWAKEKLPFSIDLFHPGWTAKKTVTLSEVSNGEVKPVTFDQSRFDYGKTEVPANTPPPPGYAGAGARGII